MSYYWVLGAGLSIMGSIASNLGVNIQKYSFMKNSKKDKHEQKGYWKQPLWVLGFFLVTLGSLGDFAALGLAAQSIVAPIGSFTLVANIVFAHFWLEEALSRRDLAGTCLIVVGSVLSALFGDHTSVSYTLSDLKSFYLRTIFLCYIFFIVFAMAVFYGVVRKIEPLKNQLMEAEQRLEEAQRNDDYETALKEDTLVTVLVNAYRPYEKMHPFCYCALSGSFGGQSILFGKMVAELIGSSLRGDNQMIYGLTYVFLLVMLTTVFFQIHFLAKALAFFDALYVVPVFQCFFISVSTVAGASYFMEFDRFTTVNWLIFPIGILLTLTGVYVLSAREMTKERPRFNRKLRRKRRKMATELTKIPSISSTMNGKSGGGGGGGNGDDGALPLTDGDDNTNNDDNNDHNNNNDNSNGTSMLRSKPSAADHMMVSDQEIDEGDEGEGDDGVGEGDQPRSDVRDPNSPTDGDADSPMSPTAGFGSPRRSPLTSPRRTITQPHPLRRTSTGSGAVLLGHMYSARNILNVNPKMSNSTPRGPTTPASIRQVLSVPPSSSSAGSSNNSSPAIGPMPSGSTPATPNKDGVGGGATGVGGGTTTTTESGGATPLGPTRTLSTFLSGLVKDVRDMTQEQWQKMSEVPSPNTTPRRNRTQSGNNRNSNSNNNRYDDDINAGNADSKTNEDDGGEYQEEFYHGPVDEEGNPIVPEEGDQQLLADGNSSSSSSSSSSSGNRRGKGGTAGAHRTSSTSSLGSSGQSQSLRIQVDAPADQESRAGGAHTPEAILSPADGYAQGFVNTRLTLQDKTKVSFFSRLATWFEKKDEKEGRVMFFT